MLLGQYQQFQSQSLRMIQRGVGDLKVDEADEIVNPAFYRGCSGPGCDWILRRHYTGN
jgi:hypothetical protein